MSVNSIPQWDALIKNYSEAVPAVVQDSMSKAVLGLVRMNREAYNKTLETGGLNHTTDAGTAVFSSDGMQFAVKNIAGNDAKDALLITVDTGSHDVLHTQFGDTTMDKSSILNAVYDVIRERKTHAPENSYVAKKLSEGIDRILKKIGEEAGEVIIAAKNGDPEEIGWEMADLIFHMWLVLGFYDLSPEIVYDKLIERRK
ncbi:MAG: phosphoribosyl-ATP diphosphatase [Brevinematales bacterium]|nr:phosphoribosyl-ATP diphosphatase [Brevinematales bacterium]